MSMNKFEVILGEQVLDFFDEIDPKAYKKIMYNIDQARKTLNPKLFKKIDSVFWEFRAEHRRMRFGSLGFGTNVIAS